MNNMSSTTLKREGSEFSSDDTKMRMPDEQIYNKQYSVLIYRARVTARRRWTILLPQVCAFAACT